IAGGDRVAAAVGLRKASCGSRIGRASAGVAEGLGGSGPLGRRPALGAGWGPGQTPWGAVGWGHHSASSGNPRRPAMDTAGAGDLAFLWVVSCDLGGLCLVRCTTQAGAPMNAIMSRVRRFLVDEDGPTAVEYAVILALIIVACIAVTQGLGTSVSGTFARLAAALGQHVGPSGPGAPLNLQPERRWSVATTPEPGAP